MIFKKKYSTLLSPKLATQLISIRHKIHQYPELSLEEIKTTALIKAECSKLNCAYIKDLSPTGLIGCIKGSNPTLKPIALRADMDALPIQEETTLKYKSTIAGKMHACGHDMHSAWLLATLHLLNKYQPKQDVIFIFQPAEEISVGANIVLKTNYLQNVTEIYGGHVDLNYQVGEFVIHDGYISATSTIYNLKLTGKSSHIARPEEGQSPLPALAEIIPMLTTLTEKAPHSTEPIILGLGTIHAGTANNISPESVTVEGSIRSLSEENKNYIINEFKKHAKAIGKNHNLQVELNFTSSSPAILNNQKTNKKVKECLTKEFGKKSCVALKRPNLAGEDFGYYAQQIPATFIRIGARNKNGLIIPAHNPKFTLDDDTLFAAALAFFAIAK